LNGRLFDLSAPQQPARAAARPLGALMNRNANLASVRYV
jgi:hypothetical protein